ncbi:acyl-CoA dehydrogenase family protein [Opitutus sp. GAS368]|uniref:acyl-CoA dehydrogenase family protein n=1 Tax=Opitutus sp. GAS368 TaxID=1882749 RepID=UPI00087B5BA8|nr:acyl-CoA dehydrogenase family protein [Opitutus sp. GAS368]SDS35607.1 Acyl-CoA dehydrogenase [Opitutus sp. GAS368]
MTPASIAAPWLAQLSPAEIAFLKKVAHFAATEIAPHADAWEKSEELPRAVFMKAGKLGLLGMTAPRARGGQGFGYAAYALAIRELAKHQAAFAIDLAAHNALGSGHLLAAGNPAQHKRVLTKLLKGTWLAAWALTEPEAGSDSGGVQTTATEVSPGKWELNGFKRYITLGRSSDIVIVMAVSGQTAEGRKEISAFLVERAEIIPVRKVPTCGLRASDTAEFKLVKAKAELVGPRGTGQATALACLDKGRIGVAAVSLGLARAALDAALKHALNRRQFGKRLADFQALQFMLADCEVELRAAEALVLQATALASRGERHTIESSVAKLYASEAASRICSRALQIHGGYGYTRDIPVERYWRDARLSEIGEGSSEVQRIVISRALLKGTAATLADIR